MHHPSQYECSHCIYVCVCTCMHAGMYLYMCVCVKNLISWYILDMFGYDEWTNPRSIMENFGYESLML